jgi:hypothetical protein
MIKFLPYLTVLLFSFSASFAQDKTDAGNIPYVSDGPYIYYQNDSLNAFWVKNNILVKEYVTPETFPILQKKFNLTFSFKDLTAGKNIRQNYNQRYNKIDSIGIIGDIHGEYETYLELLKSMGVIDKELRWKFGKGHLLVTGDVFDRGDKVTEVLWHLFGLEKQAEDSGGKVHLLLGNHELLVIDNELSYINNKYRKVEELSGIGYNELFSTSTVLGAWLRSKPVIVTINDILFVHAGLSPEMVQRKMDMKKVNRLFGDGLMGRPLDSISSYIDLPFLFTDFGPVWYRGYFSGTDFGESKLDSILDFYDKSHIVVGHTVIPCITSVYNSKLIGVDTGIMYSKNPEMLLYKEGVFYRSSLKGKRTKL